MAYVRGFIEENTRFHIGMELTVSLLSSFNNAMGTSISPSKSLFFILCDDGSDLVWKCNTTDIRADHATLKYTCKNHMFYLQNLASDGKYYYIKKDEDNVLSYDSAYNSSSALTLSTNSNVRKSLLYGGVNYSIAYADGTNTVKMKVSKPNALITPSPYNTNTNFTNGPFGVFFSNTSDDVELDLTSLNIKLFMIPSIDHSHDTTGLIQYSTTYTSSVEFFISYINNVLPSNYKPLVENTFADENACVIFTQTLDQKTKYVYSYCRGTETCGSCMGVCIKDEVCSVHSNTSTTTPMTCDHLPYETNKHDYIFILIILITFILIFLLTYFFNKQKKYKMEDNYLY
jgi:hypothetical protein